MQRSWISTKKLIKHSIWEMIFKFKWGIHVLLARICTIDMHDVTVPNLWGNTGHLPKD